MKLMSRLAAGVAVSSGLALTSLGLGTDSARAGPAAAPVTSWCPGQALPDGGIRWDMAVCHNYFITKAGTGNVPMIDRSGNPIDSWYWLDGAPPEPNHSARLAVLLSAGWAKFATR
jgi:hypothetical protein